MSRLTNYGECFCYVEAQQLRGGRPLKCPHCLGFMVIDVCLNMEGDRNQVWIDEWRCLNCGEIFDPRTLENRRLQRQDWQKWRYRRGRSLPCELTGKT